MNSKQRHYLRGLAHSLKPLVNIGKNGVTDGAYHSIDEGLKSHELIKVKIKENKKLFSNNVTNRLSCEVVGSIGNILILFRQQEYPDKRAIKLP